MFPFEFTVLGPPLSQQTANRKNLQAWKQDVAHAARMALPAGFQPSTLELSITVTYYFEKTSPDVDNFAKPIQDALQGLVYVDDQQIVSSTARRRFIDREFKVRGISLALAAAFHARAEFLHVRIGVPPAVEDLSDGSVTPFWQLPCR